MHKRKKENPPDTNKPEVSENVSAKLKDDFYAAVNEGVLNDHKQQGEESGNWNYFYDLIDKAYEEQKQILNQSADEAKKGQADKKSSAYKLGMLYLLATDQDGRDKDGITVFDTTMKPVMEAGTVQELMVQAALLQYHYGFDSLLNVEVLALDENPGEYIVQLKEMNFLFLREDFTDEEAIEETKYFFESYGSKLLTFAGYSEKEAKQRVAKIYDFVNAIAKSEKGSEYKNLSVKELQKELSNINLEQYLGNIFKTKSSEISTREVDSLSRLNGWLTADNLTVLKDYLYITNLHKFAAYLTSDTIKADQEMQEEYIGDTDETNAEKIAVTQVSELLKWDMGKLYTEKNFSEVKKQGIQKIVDDLFAEYKTILQEKDWLSAETKAKALQKLEKIDVRIGLPQDIDRYLSSYTPVLRTEGGSYFSNVLQIRKEQTEKQYDNFGQKVDRTVWNLIPQDMNPCYYPTDNSINIPVAALEAPYFSVTASEEENLGAIGTIIGHEITHAFDDLGSKYDENGDYVDWWSEADRKEFEKRAEKIVTYYNEYKTPDAMQQDGKQTMGENIADLGSMKCLSRIIEKKNLSAEKFFESYANIWASVSNGLSEALVSGMDEHASDKVRVNAVLASCELFYKTYGIKEGDGMYIKPEERVELW